MDSKESMGRINLDILKYSPFFSLAQRKETKENIGCKLLAENSALRSAKLPI
jgi:hypothetical protein